MVCPSDTNRDGRGRKTSPFFICLQVVYNIPDTSTIIEYCKQYSTGCTYGCNSLDTLKNIVNNLSPADRWTINI